MVHALIIAFAGLLCAGVARADLDLTPKLSEYNSEGFKVRKLVFLESGKDVTYIPPRDWDYSGNATKLVLHPRQKAQAEASITKSVLGVAPRFDEKTTKLLAAEALRSMPAGSTDVTLISQETNPFLFAGKETFRASWSYNFYGETYTGFLLFVNRATDQIRFQLVCRTADFEGLQKEFQRSLFSWQNL
ncbi:MAG: hypothetical protein M3N48_15210 [Verrucomicrobiota bacterium]|nr:hypothetical protein [Verrucomicrobiota bacterium]